MNGLSQEFSWRFSTDRVFVISGTPDKLVDERLLPGLHRSSLHPTITTSLTENQCIKYCRCSIGCPRLMIDNCRWSREGATKSKGQSTGTFFPSTVVFRTCSFLAHLVRVTHGLSMSTGTEGPFLSALNDITRKLHPCFERRTHNCFRTRHL